MRMNDFFCGAGGMGLGFKQAGFDIVGAWDFDKYAVQSYKENVGDHVLEADISQMKWYDVRPADIWTFGFPCQDLSIAGERKGMIEGETRSGLFYEIMRLLDETKTYSPSYLPKILLAENVKGVQSVLPEIKAQYEKRGYRMQFQVLVASEFDVPQARERYFILGIHESLDVDFKFPIGKPTSLRVRDILDDVVDPKYYLSDKAIAYMDRERKGKPRWEYHKNDFNGLASTLPAVVYKGVPYGVVRVIGKVEMKGHDVVRRVYDKDGLSPTLTTMGGGHRQPKVDENGVPRKFTPRECARLMGFPEDYKQVVSDTQFYKQMGNAVVVNVAKAIADQIKLQFGGKF